MKKTLPRWKLKYKWFMGRWAVRSKRWNPPLHIRAKQVKVEDIEVLFTFDDPMYNFIREFKGAADTFDLNGHWFSGVTTPDELLEKYLKHEHADGNMFSTTTSSYVAYHKFKGSKIISRKPRYAKYELL